eukprot:1369240-Ditylum_brightwellii.AAC.1
MATKEELLIDLSIKFGNETTRKKLKRKDPTESIGQLGLKNNPAAKFMEEINDRHKTNKDIATRLRRAPVSSKNTFQLYKNIWLLKMQYPLAITSFSKSSYLTIMKPFVRTILPKLGFNRHTAHEIIYGSHQYGGFQMAHLYKKQGVLAIKHLIDHLREETITGNQIIIALSYAQLVAGYSLPYLQEVMANRSY